MQAIILADEQTERFRGYAKYNAKCMIAVNGIPLIERMLKQLDKCNLSRIIIVICDYEKEVIDFINTLNVKTPISFEKIDASSKPNSIFSLIFVKEWLLKEDTLLLESNIIFDDSVLASLLDDPRETLALVDKYESWMDGACVVLGEDDSIKAFVPGKKLVFSDISKYYKTLNIYKFSRFFSEKFFVPFLGACSCAFDMNKCYDDVLRVITSFDNYLIKAKRLGGKHCCQIEDLQDLDIASSIFANNPQEKLKSISERYGGYWRFPNLIDFYYLVNPYYPPQKLIDEIKANFTSLLTHYPSGQYVNSLLAANNFGVKQEYIAVGNGAAELIKAVMEELPGVIGFIRPTFEEYPNRFAAGRGSVVFNPFKDKDAKGLPEYSAGDIIKFFSSAHPKINTLILINPDIPTGNYLPKAQVAHVAEWCEKNDIRLVLDESFVNFADEEGTFLKNDLLERFPDLIVIKSLSKGYGVPGLRLGILASADVKLVSSLKKDVAIWNINSFAEFYMQIMEKYKNDYALGIIKYKKARAHLISGLSKFSKLKVYPTQANYVLVELLDGLKAKEFAAKLLCDYNILIKDLSERIMIDDRQFIRLAIRSEEDNMQLIESFKKLFAEV